MGSIAWHAWNWRLNMAWKGWKVMITLGKCRTSFAYQLCWTRLDADALVEKVPWHDDGICTGAHEPGWAWMLFDIPASKKVLSTKAYTWKIICCLNLACSPWEWSRVDTLYHLIWSSKPCTQHGFQNLRSLKFVYMVCSIRKGLCHPYKEPQWQVSVVSEIFHIFI